MVVDNLLFLLSNYLNLNEYGSSCKPSADTEFKIKKEVL